MITINDIKIEKTETEVAKELRDLFIDIGVNYKSKGFRYLITACTEVVFNPHIIDMGITKQLYPDLAKFYNTTYGCVERCIRSSIEKIKIYNNPTAIEIFGRVQKLTNGGFISAVSDYIRINSLS
jgi:two-component system response regulator (stage 0 sporulation protein A)